MPTLPEDLFTTVPGFISLAEAELLYRLACEVSKGGRIVEIGSYKARSTIALALGAKEAGATVWAIDHHPTYEAGGTDYGMDDNQAYYENLAHYQVGDMVMTINLPSYQTWVMWTDDIDLLWIDGDHSYEQVRLDFNLWGAFSDTVALHDTAGFHEGVTRLVEEILASGKWERFEVVDATTIFRKVKK